MKELNSKLGSIKLVEDRARKVLQVGLPPGARLGQAIKAVERLDAVIERLTGCPCISGLDIHFFNHFEEQFDVG